MKQHSTSTTDEYDSLILYLAMLTTERTALLLQIDKLKSDQVDASTKISKAFKPSPLQSPKLNRSLLSNSNSTPIPVTTISLPQQSPLLGSTPNICHRSKQKKYESIIFLLFKDYLFYCLLISNIVMNVNMMHDVCCSNISNIKMRKIRLA